MKCIRIRFKNSIMILLVVYRPESKPCTKIFFTDLAAVFEILVTYRCQIVMTGDFHVRVDRPDDINSASLEELLTLFDLVQHVKKSTHDLVERLT